MNIRPISPLVTAYSGQNANKTSENQSFGMLRTPFAGPIERFVRNNGVNKEEWAVAKAVVEAAQKSNRTHHISPRIHIQTSTLVFDVVNVDSRQVVRTVPATGHNFVGALHGASEVASSL